MPIPEWLDVLIFGGSLIHVQNAISQMQTEHILAVASLRANDPLGAHLDGRIPIGTPMNHHIRPPIVFITNQRIGCISLIVQ